MCGRGKHTLALLITTRCSPHCGAKTEQVTWGQRSTMTSPFQNLHAAHTDFIPCELGELGFLYSKKEHWIVNVCVCLRILVVTWDGWSDRKPMIQSGRLIWSMWSRLALLGGEEWGEGDRRSWGRRQELLGDQERREKSLLRDYKKNSFTLWPW